ncbi:acyl-CoA reductase [Arthrobacter sp. FW306-2-2C-D06B]|uniref:acyl-CoA reductase n=1 Tax=Arthrobacter sp. FW306-2-2C-D06B TaxID=2879618 RepID=UPI001F2F3887|nr:acyl-CoA reductase [Arthrobacter sp. FW306-2-2C-D06B]UKA60679.1 acyl-CoA reductase [Arthrobacter sp. FW306-2-2C-D06B]
MDEQRSRRRPRFPGWEVGPAAVGLGLVAHLVSGGVSPGVPVLIALTALLSMCASLLARVNLPSWLLLVLCGVAQQVLHLAFDRLSGTFSVVAPAQHQHAGSGWQPGQLAATPSVAAGHSPDLMLDTHVAAALLTALLVARADISLTRALALLHRTTPGGPSIARPGTPYPVPNTVSGGVAKASPKPQR